jgi:hypothetical protein
MIRLIINLIRLKNKLRVNFKNWGIYSLCFGGRLEFKLKRIKEIFNRYKKAIEIYQLWQVQLTKDLYNSISYADYFNKNFIFCILDKIMVIKIYNRIN